MARRRTFAQGMARRWAPFADPAFHVAWAGHVAMVWGWSSSLVLAPVADGERAPRRIVPESLFVGGVREDGVELLAVDAGYEGRAWNAGVLVASTWWPALPSSADWIVFLRGAGRAAMPEPPAPVEAHRLPAPWSAGAAARTDFARHRGLVVPILGAIVLLAIGFPVGSGLRLLAETASLEGAIAKQEGLVAEILAARESAEADAAELQSLLELRPSSGQIRTMSALLKAMPPGGWQVLEWRLPEPGRLEVVLRTATPDPPAMVRSLEASRLFEAVGVEMGTRPDEVVVKARLTGPVGAAGEGEQP